jgi:hypothetical protein
MLPFSVSFSFFKGFIGIHQQPSCFFFLFLLLASFAASGVFLSFHERIF